MVDLRILNRELDKKRDKMEEEKKEEIRESELIYRFRFTNENTEDTEYDIIVAVYETCYMEASVMRVSEDFDDNVVVAQQNVRPIPNLNISIEEPVDVLETFLSMEFAELRGLDVRDPSMASKIASKNI